MTSFILGLFFLVYMLVGISFEFGISEIYPKNALWMDQKSQVGLLDLRMNTNYRRACWWWQWWKKSLACYFDVGSDKVHLRCTRPCGMRLYMYQSVGKQNFVNRNYILIFSYTKIKSAFMMYLVHSPPKMSCGTQECFMLQSCLLRADSTRTKEWQKVACDIG